MARLRSVNFGSRVLAGAAALLAAGTGSALAIPSPELVVGSLTSISQLLALGSALLGGGAAAAVLRGRSGGGSQRASRILFATAVGLFIAFAASLALNVYLYVDQKNERQARLEETLSRPSRAPAGLPENSDAKELTFGEQLKHPLRLDTANAEKLLNDVNEGKRPDVIFLDVRERAEQSSAMLRGATAVRFPDLPAKNLDLSGKKAILFCHDGNRSSEACEALAKQGIDCRFVVGGLEKWVVENRSIERLAARHGAELRASPPYKNSDVLISTDEARRLVLDKKAVFVDVRHPADFASQHINGAINLDMRRMPTAELDRRIAELPRKPMILPCYDRRGCFFAEVLGFELSKAGHDVRGRYTLPWEYFVKRPPPPHVEMWTADKNLSIWVKGGHWLAGVLKSASTWTGLVLAIVLLAFVSRLLVLPFSLKAERDQMRSRAAAGELKELKTRYKDDPVARGRAIRAFYKRHGLTPVRNLIALAFLPVMGVALIAVESLSATSGGKFLWISNLGERDPTLVLPVIFAALIALYLDQAFVRTALQRVITWAIALPLLTATAMLFTAGSEIYLITTAALLLLQRALVSGAFGRLAADLRRWRPGEAIVPLSEPERLVNCGNKAFRLARMRQEGLPVPNGVVLTSKFLADFGAATPEARTRHLDMVWRAVGAEKVVVRSSAAAEDGAQHSFAGVFDSVLNVERAGLEAGVSRVMASFDAARVKSYGVERGGGSVLVQRMVDAQYAGVLFTHDPAAGGLSMIELVEGTADGLVSGAVAPQTFRCGRVSGEIIGDAKPPIVLMPLLQLGRRAEQIFGTAQDIEWTYLDGEFYLVQSRDITRLLQEKVELRNEYARVLDRAAGASPGEIVFAQNELAEMLPRPTPLSFSVMEALWASGGSVDVACRRLGIRYGVEEDAPSYLATIFGRLYIDKRQERIRAGRISALAARRLGSGAERIEREFRDNFLPAYSREMALREAVDFDRLATPDLIATLKQMHEDFVHNTHVEVDVINVAASFYFERAKKLLAEHGLEATAHLAHVPETDYDRVLTEAARLNGAARREFLIAQAGHRAVLDYELASPRYAEVPDPIEALCEAEAQKTQTAVDEAAEDAVLLKAGQAVAEAAAVACRFERLKEDAKHHSLRQLALIRRAVLALDRRSGLENLAFYLTMDELLAVPERAGEMRSVAIDRYYQSLQFAQAAPLPPVLTIRELERASAGIDAHKEAGGEICGTRVSGAGLVSGRACVVSAADSESGGPIPGFVDGDIVVSSMVHPAWLPYFGRAGGFVCLVGGWLSHTAILAREHNLVMIVGARGLDAIADGSQLRLHLDGTVEIVEDPEDDQEVPQSLAAE